MPIPPNKLIIVGGGIAGLSAAWFAQKAGIPYTVLEKSPRWGGLMHTERVDDYVIEFGPDAFITRKPHALALAHDLGLEPIAVNDTPERIYVLIDGRLVPLPEGLRLLVPTKLAPFLRSPLLSTWGKMRLLLDWVIPPRKEDSDESLAGFVRRRMGDEALTRLADPLLAGVYNADMEQQSILATFPQYRALERKHGSLIRGMRRSLRDAPPTTAPALVSFAGGVGAMIDALVTQLSGDLCLETGVESLTRTTDGYTLTLTNGEKHTTNRLILATPAHVSAGLLAEIAPDTATRLGAIRYEGVGSTSLGFRREDVPRNLDAYGVVIPAGRKIDGMQWSSSKWDGRAPQGEVLIRVFFGGPNTRAMLHLDDDALMETIRAELNDILGITAQPHLIRTGRLHHAYPQYDVGHIERVDAIMGSLPAGIALAGNAYYGVGVPDTIKSAKRAVTGA